MDFVAHLPTVHLLNAVTLGLQALVIAFQLPLRRHYRGILAFLLSALLIAAGSVLLFGQSGPPGGPGAPQPAPPTDGPQNQPPDGHFLFLGSMTLSLAGTVLQYLALAGFLNRRPNRWLLAAVGLAALGFLGFMVVQPQVLPAVPVREALTAVMLLAIAQLLATSRTEGFRIGAWVTGLAFLGYGLLSVYRIGRGILEPGQMLPGPSLQNEVDGLVLFCLSFLWTAGFLLMVNQRLQSDLAALASRDPLTRCWNRRAMGERLRIEEQRFARYGRPYALILIDLDRFKTINDTRGHQVGDQVLQRASELLRDGVRAGDTVARWGGEEFLILLPETEEAAAIELAERLRVRWSVEEAAPGLKATLSAGVVAARPSLSADQLCALADQALYQAKLTRNRVVRAEA